MFRVFVRAEDGRHEITECAVSFDKAKEIALEWLGDTYNKVSDRVYIGMYGGRLTIEEEEPKREQDRINEMLRRLISNDCGVKPTKGDDVATETT